MDRLSRDEFLSLPLDELEALTGLTAPQNGADEADYRDRAWESYKQDVTNQEEWVGIEGENAPEDERA